MGTVKERARQAGDRVADPSRLPRLNQLLYGTEPNFSLAKKDALFRRHF
jgi:hypothetical protein